MKIPTSLSISGSDLSLDQWNDSCAGALSKYVVSQVEIEESHIAHLDLRDLPKNWRAEPAPKRLWTLGDEWLDSGKSAVLRVPSAIVVGEFNYLLNPLHPDFFKLRIHDPEKFSIDKRLYSSHLGNMPAYIMI